MASETEEKKWDRSEDEAAGPLAPLRWNSPVITISVGYAGLATLWILFSDYALAMIARTPERMVDWSVYKGIGFVSLSAGFLYLLLRRTYGALESTNERLRQRKRELRRLGRMNAALSHINQAIVRFPVREELFQRVCDVLTTDGGFQLVWIGWHDPADNRLLPAAVAGQGKEFIQALRVYADERPEGRGPAGRAFRSGRLEVFNDMLDPAAALPLGAEMHRRGVRSAAGVPILEGGRPRGVLVVYSSESDSFQDGELALLREAAGDIGFALDVLAREADRRRAEETAAAERRFSATMIDSMPGVLYFYDQNLRFLRWNRNFEQVSGYSAEEIARMGPLDFFGQADRPLVRERIAQVFERGESSMEVPLLTKAGRALPYFLTGRRVEFAGQSCLVGVGIDISERARAEEALRESEERFRATFEQAAVGIAHVAPDGRFYWVNEKFCRITGWTREELFGLTFGELAVPGERAEGDAAHRAMLEGERDDFTAETRFRHKDGGVVWVNVVVKILRDAERRAKYFVAVVADISERKQLEQQFLRAQRMESIGTLAGGIAHDLNNLLSPIMLGIELLRLHRLPPAITPTMDGMERSARRAAGLVRQILSFARGVEGARTSLDLRDVVREVESFVLSSFPRGIVWRCDLPADLWPVTGDSTQLHQVLLNLCVNARDALAAGGCLSLRARNVVLDSAQANAARGEMAGRHVLIEVADNGCGMDPGVKERIFEPFFTTKPPGKGTGLGLSTVLGIVRSHGGRVEVDSEPGRGTTFRIFLRAKAETAPSLAGSPRPEGPSLGAGELILVVDDENSLLEVTRQMLVAFGYRVLAASDAKEALALFQLRRTEIAAVIADSRMPGLEGPGLIEAMRAIDPRARLIAVGGPADGEGFAEGGMGPGFCLPRPYAADTLLAVLRRALATKAPGAAGP